MCLKFMLPFQLQVTLGQVLRAVVTFRGILIEWVVVRAYNEPLVDEDGKVSLLMPLSSLPHAHHRYSKYR